VDHLSALGEIPLISVDFSDKYATKKFEKKGHKFLKKREVTKTLLIDLQIKQTNCAP